MHDVRTVPHKSQCKASSTSCAAGRAALTALRSDTSGLAAAAEEAAVGDSDLEPLATGAAAAAEAGAALAARQAEALQAAAASLLGSAEIVRRAPAVSMPLTGDWALAGRPMMQAFTGVELSGVALPASCSTAGDGAHCRATWIASG